MDSPVQTPTDQLDFFIYLSACLDYRLRSESIMYTVDHLFACVLKASHMTP